MGKFVLKDTARELGGTYFNSTCKVGIRVGAKHRFGDVAIMFDGITLARTYINREVLRQALLDDPAKTEALLGIKVTDLVAPAPAPEPKPEPVEVKEEPKPEPIDIEIEDVAPEVKIEKETEEITIESEVIEPELKLEDMTKAGLIEFAAQYDLVFNSKTTKAKMIEKIKEVI